MWIAWLASFILFWEFGSSNDKAFFLLKADSTNLISQFDILGKPSYDLYDAVKTGSSVDFGVSITKHKFWRLVDEVKPFTFNTDDYLHISKIEFERGENDFSTLVVTSDSVFVYDASNYEGLQKGLYFEWSFEKNQTFNTPELQCNESMRCEIKADSHFTDKDNLIVVILEIRYCPRPKEPLAYCTLHLGILTLNRGNSKEGNYRLSCSQSFDLKSIEIPNSGLEYKDRGLRAFKLRSNFYLSKDKKLVTWVLLRFNSMMTEQDRSYLKLYRFRFRNQTFFLDHNRTAVYYSLQGDNKLFKVKKVYRIGDFVIVANVDRVISWYLPELFKYSNFSSGTSKEGVVTKGILGVFELNSYGIWCNHMNFNELSCLYVDKIGKDPGSSNSFKVLDLVQIDDHITTVQSTGNTIFSMYTFKRAFNTKHYILIIANTGINKTQAFICDKRINSTQEVSTSNFSLFPPCTSADFKVGHRAEVFSQLLYDDNYSNQLNGFILVTFTKENGTNMKQRTIQPLLLSGQYFEIVPNVDLSNHLCHRYLENCAQLDLIFKSRDNRNEEKRTFYIINENFTSILPKQSLSEFFSDLSYSNMALRVEDFFLGDFQNLKITSLQDIYAPNSQGTERSISKTESHISEPPQFSFRFPNSAFKGQVASPFALEWFLIRIVDDKPISLTFGLISLIPMRETKIRKFSLLRTLPNVEYQPNQEAIAEKYLAANTIFIQQKPPRHFLLVNRNSEASTASMIMITYYEIKNNKQSETRANISLEIYGSKKGKDRASHSEANLGISIQKKELIDSVKSPLDESQDLFAIITSKRLLIYKIITEDKGTTKLKELKNFFLSKFKLTESLTESLLNVTVIDLLYLENLLILDLRLKINETIMGVTNDFHRVYVFFMNPLLDSYYKLGYISIEPHIESYFLYYYHIENKAVLVLPELKEIREYSIDDVKLDIKLIGKPVKPMNIINFKTYGAYSVDQIYNIGIIDTVLHSRSLGFPSSKGYFLILARVSKEGHSSHMVLMGKIDENPHVFLKSHIINLHAQDCQLNLPSYILDDQSEVIPVVEFCKDSEVLHVHMIGLETEIGLSKHYQNYLSDKDSSTNIKLGLGFKDVAEKEYEEAFLVGRNVRYLIDLKIKDYLQIVGDKASISLSNMGLVNEMHFDCSSGVTKVNIRRHNFPEIICSEEKFSVIPVPAIKKENYLDDNPYQLNAIKDFKRIPLGHMQQLKGLFVLLLKETIIIFSSKKEQLKPLIQVNLKLSEDDLFECLSIKAVKMAQNQTDSYKFHLFCTIGFHLKEVIYSLSWTILNEVATYNAKVITVTLADLIRFDVPLKLRNSILLGQNNLRSIDDLLFVVGKKVLWSYGERLGMDIYKVSEPNENQTQRFFLLNSSITEKTDMWKLISFKIMRFQRSRELDHKNTKFYLMMRLSSHPNDENMSLVFTLLKYQNSLLDIVSERKMNSIQINKKLPKATASFDFISIISEVGSQKFSATEDEEWREHLLEHYIVGIFDNMVYQYSLGSFNENFDDRIRRSGHSPVKYDFAGLCDTNSEYSIEISAKYLVLSCVPEYSDSSPSYILVFHREVTTNQDSSIFPLQVVRFENGIKISRDGLVKLAVGDDGSHRILRASKRTIITQYLLDGEPKLEIKADPNRWLPRRLNFELKNYYETKKMTLSLYTSKISYFRLHMKFLIEDIGLTIVICLYLLVLLCFLTGSHLLMKNFIGSDQSPLVEQTPYEEKRISKRELAQKILTDPF